MKKYLVFFFIKNSINENEYLDVELSFKKQPTAKYFLGICDSYIAGRYNTEDFTITGAVEVSV